MHDMSTSVTLIYNEDHLNDIYVTYSKSLWSGFSGGTQLVSCTLIPNRRNV